MTRARLEGTFAALTTPFAGDEVSYSAFKENLIKYNESQLDGYVILGSTGEAVSLSDDESLKLVEEAVKVSAPQKKLIVGTARESTRQTLEFTTKISQFPLFAVLIRTPSYYKRQLTPQALKEHYLRLAEGSPLPVILYNIPQNTGVSLDLETLVELAQHPNIIGIKDSSGNLNFLVRALPHLPADFSFLLGAGSLIFPGVSQGAAGGILALAAVIPDQCARLFQLTKEGNHQEARQLQLQLAPLNSLLTQEYGIPAIKFALDKLGFYGGLPRSPLLPLSSEGESKVLASLKKVGALT